MFKHITQISEQAFLLDFGSEINHEINTKVVNFSNYILIVAFPKDIVWAAVVL